MWDHLGDGVAKRLQDAYGAEVSSAWARSPAERRSVLETAASDSVDLIVCVGPEFDRSILTEGPRFPRTAFVLDRGMVLAPNVARMEFLYTGAAYLGGVTAAVLGGSTIGILEVGRGPVIDDIEDGFEQGFRCRHPWGGRIERASGAAGIEALAERGVTVALYAELAPDPEVLAAADACGVHLVTIGRHTLDTHPDVVAAAIVVDIPEAVGRIAADVVDDTFTGKVYAFDLGSGVVDLRLQPSLAENQSLVEALDQARAAVNAGMVEIEALGL